MGVLYINMTVPGIHDSHPADDFDNGQIVVELDVGLSPPWPESVFDILGAQARRSVDGFENYLTDGSRPTYIRFFQVEFLDLPDHTEWLERQVAAIDDRIERFE